MGSSEVVKEDIDDILSASFIDWQELKGKNILVSGGTGLIGSMLVRALAEADRTKGLDMKLMLIVRDEEKARRAFSDHMTGCIRFITGCVEELPHIDEKIDLIIHAASNTSSSAFVNEPVEVMDTALSGSRNMLQLAKNNPGCRMVYLSTMEAYGYPDKGHKVTEKDTGSISSLELRSSYPLSKLMCESMCCAYAAEYGVQTAVIRLTQTFGPGVKSGDKRIFGYFADCVRKHDDIVLKTRGETERSYLYIADAVTAVLTVLLKGGAGEAYNAADETSYCSIAQMAQSVAGRWGLAVKYDIQDPDKNGYLNTLYMDLDTAKLKDLGWKPIGGGRSITQMFERMIADMDQRCPDD